MLQFSKALTEVKTEGTRRQGRRLKQLRGDLKEKRMYWNLKEEALDRTVLEKPFWKIQYPNYPSINTTNIKNDNI